MAADNEESVRKIVEMGFSEEEAVKALECSGGNVEMALAYIFQGPEEPAPSSKADGHNQSTVGYSSNSKDPSASILASQSPSPPPLPPAPPVPIRRPADSMSASQHIEDIDNTLGSFHVPFEIEDTDSDELDESQGNLGVDDGVLKGYVSVYDNIYRYERGDDDPSVLMPIKNGMLESYLNPILAIFHQVPSLRKDIFHHEFATLGYHPHWFKGDHISIPEETFELKQDDKVHDLRFLLEVQRLFAFLDNDSKRAFTSILNFIRSFPAEAKQNFQIVESLRDAYEVFTGTLIDQLQQVHVKSPSSYFQNVATDLSSGESQPFSVFNIQADDIKQDLYRTLHSVLWHDEPGNEELDTSQTISSLADIATFTFEPISEEDYNPIGLQIKEEFYPQIYTTPFKDLLSQMDSRRKEFDKERREIANELMKIRVHMGKQTLVSLSHSIEYLSQELEEKKEEDSKIRDALQDLKEIEKNVISKKDQLIERQTELLEKKKDLSSYNIQYLLENSPMELEPYILTGIIISPTEFAFLKKDKSLMDDTYSMEWCFITYKPEEMDDFKIAKTEFNDLKSLIHATTSDYFKTPIVLVYVKQSRALEEVEVEVPQSVLDFIAKDNSEVSKSLELILSSSSGGETDSDENMDYDYGEPESNQEAELIDFDINQVMQKANDAVSEPSTRE